MRYSNAAVLPPPPSPYPPHPPLIPPPPPPFPTPPPSPLAPHASCYLRHPLTFTPPSPFMTHARCRPVSSHLITPGLWAGAGAAVAHSASLRIAAARTNTPITFAWLVFSCCRCLFSRHFPPTFLSLVLSPPSAVVSFEWQVPAVYQ